MLDFYRGILSARRLGVLVRQLPVESALVRALNGGQSPMSRTDHLLADLWVMLDHIRNPKSKVSDHPRRAEFEAKKRNAAKAAKVIQMNEKRKRTHGLG